MSSHFLNCHHTRLNEKMEEEVEHHKEEEVEENHEEDGEEEPCPSLVDASDSDVAR